MRVRSSLINIAAGLGNQIVITALSFISRTVFINSLGIEYLGINGLFTNLLAMLTLAEAGIGSSIIYSLYKPVADNDRVTINKLMRLYRNAYLVIALIVTLLGLSLLPFLDHVVQNSSVEHVSVIYLIFLLNTVTPYLFSYKNSFLNVSQKGYIVTLIFTLSSILSTCLKIGILTYTKNYILFLAIDSVITLSTAIILTLVVNNMYPFLREKVIGRLDSVTKQGIVKNVKAIVLQNTGSYLVLGTENILISTFVSVAAVGLYSNYKMLIEIGRTFINQIFSNMYHSIGNLVSQESKEKIYAVYKVTLMLNFWLYSLFAIVLSVLIQPFITLWIGSQFLMPGSVLVLLLLLFYERGMRNSITTVKTTAGIFHQDRYAPLLQAAVCLAVSIMLVQTIGIAGVFIGSLASALAVPFWTTPYLVYRNVFKRPLREYFLAYLTYTVVGLGAYFMTSLICRFIPSYGFMAMMAKGTVGFTAVNVLYIALFYRTDEFGYLLGISRGIIRRLALNRKTKPNMEA
ncbi:lipopolysaccharide biosynthesis protein [Paenibacillus nasutitermitis]|uniref:Sugar translocase n=1 Tax=Paenibacillus nasutitermitis TaxID=1652958 RepID=A0A916Z4G6_9BACL|nr:hypothetical protein [Paenibacillus nasutitermitis]GGD73249.1 sugar translocase [Paenibacillus nasutitermitis]